MHSAHRDATAIGSMAGLLKLGVHRFQARTGIAAVRIAYEMVNEGLITKQEAIMRVSPDQLP